MVAHRSSFQTLLLFSLLACGCRAFEPGAADDVAYAGLKEPAWAGWKKRADSAHDSAYAGLKDPVWEGWQNSKRSDSAHDVAYAGLKEPAWAGLRKKADTGLVSTAYWASWHNSDFPLSSVPWDRYTHMTFAFAVTTPDVKTLSLGEDEPLLSDFVDAAHAHGVKAKVSVGGWTGSMFYSSAVATAENRTAFVKTITDFAKKFNLDGIDLDWEYPARQGIGCNTISPNDTSNLQAFLEELRAHEVGSKLILSAATSIVPFTDASGNPSTDVSAFARLLDYISIMNYDIWGPWSPTVGPNAPLNDTCASPDRQMGSAVSAVAAWNNAGIPLNQLLLGIAGYGHSFSVSKADAFVSGSKTELALYPPFNSSRRLPADVWDDLGPTVDACGATNPPGGNFPFWYLVKGGYLDEQGKNITGVPYIFDECSQTPYVYNATREIMISFDDPRSFAAKGAFIKETGLAGFALWEAGGDYKTVLLDAIRSTAL